jgi:hypothetical protein
MNDTTTNNPSTTTLISEHPVFSYAHNCLECNKELIYNNRTRAAYHPIVFGCICIERKYCVDCLLKLGYKKQSNILICPYCLEFITSISLLHLNPTNNQEILLFEERRYFTIPETLSLTDSVSNPENQSNSNPTQPNINYNSNPTQPNKSRKISYSHQKIPCPYSINGCSYYSQRFNVKRHLQGPRACHFKY